MSSTTETPTATFERSKTKVLPVTENSTAENDTAVTEAADAIETPEPSVVDESPTPDAKPVHTWGVLPVVEQDMPLPDIDDVTSNAGSDAIPINKNPTNPSSGDEVDSGDGNADGKSDTKSVKCDSPGDEAIDLPNNKESDATAPIPDAGCTEGAFDAGVGGEGETSDKTDNAEDSACGKLSTMVCFLCPGPVTLTLNQQLRTRRVAQSPIAPLRPSSPMTSVVARLTPFTSTAR